jgi:hypothetical protein
MKPSARALSVFFFQLLISFGRHRSRMFWDHHSQIIIQYDCSGMNTNKEWFSLFFQGVLIFARCAADLIYSTGMNSSESVSRRKYAPR